jgi:hypothetical protein
MKTLTLHELSLDDIPEDGLPIIFFSSTSSFGMFEQHYTKQGIAEYMYGDIADSLEEALGKGGHICLSFKSVDEEDDNMIPLMCDDTYLREGCLWMYEHEYYPVLDNHHYPFQEWSYHLWGLDKCLCEKYGEDVVEECVHPREGPLKFIKQHILFNNVKFIVEWIEYEDRTPHMMRYSVEESV